MRQIKKPQPLFFSRLFVVSKDETKVLPIIDRSTLTNSWLSHHLRRDSLENSLNHSGLLVGMQYRPQGRLISRSSELFFSNLSGLHDGRPSLCFPVSSFRPGGGSLGFTRIIRPVKGYLHKMGFRVSSFLDDFLLLAESPEELNKISA